MTPLRHCCLRVISIWRATGEAARSSAAAAARPAWSYRLIHNVRWPCYESYLGPPGVESHGIDHLR